MDEAPLIVTVAVDRASDQLLTEWRRRYFPPERNYLAAHLTLFHKLPGSSLAAVEKVLTDVASGFNCFEVYFSEVHANINGGFVAITVKAAQLGALRSTLASRFCFDLTPQDQQGLRPHVTVTNKGTAVTAKTALAGLQDEFSPWYGQATALQLHRYLGGPWQLLATYPLASG